MSANKAFNSPVRPLFLEALIAINFFNPSRVKCYLFFIHDKANLKNLKSRCFFVCKGYLLKWFITTDKSLRDSTLNCTPSFPIVYIFPTPKVSCIFSNMAISFVCIPI